MDDTRKTIFRTRKTKAILVPFFKEIKEYRTIVIEPAIKIIEENSRPENE